MNQSDLEQLPFDQRRRAMLGIALGYKFDYTKRCASSDEWAFGVHPTYMPSSIWLDKWHPAGDGVLMWKLVCDLRDYFRAGFCYHGGNGSLVLALDSEERLIDVFIEEDPLRNIGKWKQMQRFKV